MGRGRLNTISTPSDELERAGLVNACKKTKRHVNTFTCWARQHLDAGIIWDLVSRDGHSFRHSPAACVAEKQAITCEFAYATERET